MNSVEVISEISNKDYREIVYFNVFRKNKWGFWLIVVATIVSLFTMMGRIMDIFEVSDFLFYTSIIFIGLWILLIVVTEFIVKQFINSDKIVLGKERITKINYEKITVESGDISVANFTWDTIYKAYEIKNYYLIYVNFQQAIIVAKRDLTEEQKSTVREILNTKLGKKYYIRCK